MKDNNSPTKQTTCACGTDLGPVEKGTPSGCPECGRIVVRSEKGVFAHQGGRVRMEKAPARYHLWCPDCRLERQKVELAQKIQRASEFTLSDAQDDELDLIPELAEDGLITRTENAAGETVFETEVDAARLPDIDEDITTFWENEDIPDSVQCDCGCRVPVDAH